MLMRLDQGLLVSGLFFAPRIKKAAQIARAWLGKDYLSLHVRRGDRLGDLPYVNAPAVVRDALTQPRALNASLWAAAWPSGSTVLVASDETTQEER